MLQSYYLYNSVYSYSLVNQLPRWLRRGRGFKKFHKETTGSDIEKLQGGFIKCECLQSIYCNSNIIHFIITRKNAKDNSDLRHFFNLLH
jgi:hypothetical protein